MMKRLPILAVLALCAGLRAQTASPEVEIANLHEDVNGLSQRLADLTLRVEQLESDNAALREQIKAAGQGAATVVQLNEAIAALGQHVDAELEKAGRAAIPTAHDGATSTFSDDFPKTGLNYTVQRGETLALIAKKTGAKLADIINANKIADPSRIQAGQALFIPGGK